MIFNPSPTLRIASGLVGLCVALIVLADLVLGILPNRQLQADQQRKGITEAASVLVAEAMGMQDLQRTHSVLDAMRSRSTDMVSAGVRRADGALLVSSGAHAADWVEHEQAKSSATRVVVPIQSAEGQWGRVEFAFEPVLPETLAGWMKFRTLWIALGLPLVAVLLVYVYLRRALMNLNPMAAVPERLRDAFDGLTEGVALLDAKGRVVLANSALRDIAAVDQQHMHGRMLSDAARLALADRRLANPWNQVLLGGDPVRGVRVLVGAGEQPKVGMMNCSPIRDRSGRVRGCLASVHDVTEIERNNGELRNALAELRRSRGQIEKQNLELVKLAACDGLTGLLNRRAFFDNGNAILARLTQAGGCVAVAMVDVDHFKQFNDKYGHATGDLVLRRVADCLRNALRQDDVVARYGGEEFCVLMEGVDESTALALAERARRAIQTDAGRKLHEGREVSVTASLGICWRAAAGGPLDLSEILRHSDEALYEAKRSGRNVVRLSVRQPEDQPN